MNWFSALWSVIICVGMPALATAQDVFYVDPLNGNDNNNGTSMNTAFKSIVKARNVVRTLNNNMSRDIFINLRAGIHTADTTFTLSSEDGGANGHYIIYQSYQCEPAVISGGIKITGWIVHDASKNIYKASVDPSINSRQLYVNGIRAIRARSIDAAGWSEVGDGYNCPEEVSGWGNIPNIEVVSHMVWKCHRGPIATINGTHATMSQPYWQNLHLQFVAPPVWIENAYELLDAEGEWYLDRTTSTLYYKPRAGENMATAEVILPRQEIVLRIKDTRNIEFRGISFEHATWLLPNTPEGFSCHQADERITTLTWFDFKQMPGNIELDHCTDVRFNSCVFKHLGGTALHLSRGCRKTIIYNNTFTDISGTAISIGPLNDSLPAPADLLEDNTVTNNLITKVAAEYSGCVGILVGHTDHTIVSHNEVRNLPYTGITIGWGWSNAISASKNNEVSYNLVDSTVTLLHDGGGIYTLSAQRGTQIHHNYVKNTINDHAALYIDQGSSYIRWHHNVLENSYRWVDLTFETCRNDTVDFNYYNNDAYLFGGENCILENNVYVQNGNFPSEALDIISHAGRMPAGQCNDPVPTIDEEAGFSITVYPNPSPGAFHISTGRPFLENYTIRLYNYQGQLLEIRRLDRSQVQSTWYLNKYAPGLYLVHITSGKYNYQQKIIRQ